MKTSTDIIYRATVPGGRYRFWLAVVLVFAVLAGATAAPILAHTMAQSHPGCFDSTDGATSQESCRSDAGCKNSCASQFLERRDIPDFLATSPADVFPPKPDEAITEPSSAPLTRPPKQV